ncbi:MULTISPECIES: hypothetical protein [Haloferax]|uniref:DUF2238 domain-containing protein n=1 Tax=Haloferax marinum TaxID=2666143 RepID=A0A6A8GDG1_9EURY|nr:MULTISPECIES: hypothetical protein [Haloferax]KAB1191279.1 hypothetical protein Hfx1150_16530 [Haloferax sp. CBA1150]MRW98173.1 hypothetical protein [Haloferax marinum]
MTDSTQHPGVKNVEHGVRGAIVLVFLVGIRRRNPGAVVNAIFSLAGTYIPATLERVLGVEFHPWQRVYIETAMLTHSVGMLGPYDDVWWWDHVTHTHSASVLGGIVHVVSHRRGHNPRSRVLGIVVCFGILWELIEYGIHFAAKRLGIEPILVQYGREDTVFDLLFNLVGALLVVVFGDRLLDNFTDEP